MPAIGDQVATLEHDHTEALAKIDSLVASNAALVQRLQSLTDENAALNKYADEIKAMVESVASGALKMLQAARAPIIPTSPVVRARDLTDKQLGDHVADVAIGAGILLTPGEKSDVVSAVKQVNAVIPQSAPATPEELDEQDAGNANAIASDSGDEHRPPVAPPANIFDTVKSETTGDLKAIEAKIADIPDAVERMLHHSSASSAPPVTAIRMPVDMTMIVEHDAGGLPMFLRRGTTFDMLARARFDT